MKIKLAHYVKYASFVLLFCFFFIAVISRFADWTDAWDKIVHPLGYSSFSLTYFFGTNSIGQNIFLRGLCALSESFESGFVISLGSLFLALGFGVLAGFSGSGLLAKKIFWLAACLEMIPFYLLILPLAQFHRDEKWPLYLLLSSLLWTGVARALALQVNKLLQSKFILASVSLGASRSYLFRAHILPALSPILKVEALSLFATVIKMEAFLSFLGFGLSSKIGLGQMLAEGMMDMVSGYYGNFVFSSLALFLLLLSLNVTCLK